MLGFMKKILHAFLLVFSIPSSLSALDSFDIYQALEKSTVRITIWENYDSDRDKSAFFGGSGIVFNRVGDKYFILTNAHVVLEKYCLFYEEECEDLWHDEKTRDQIKASNIARPVSLEYDEA